MTTRAERRRGKKASLLAGMPTEYLKLLPDHLLAPNPDIYLSDNFVVFDLETNTLGHKRSPMPCWAENSIVCGSWCVGVDGEAHNIYGNELEMAPLVEALEKADFIVAHNGKFDMGWLKRAGIDLFKVILYDTMIGEYVRLGNRKGQLSLDALCQREFGIEKAAFINICMKKGVDPGEMPKSKLVGRCNKDILTTRMLFLRQRKQLHEAGLLPCVYTRCLLSAPLADIESNGMCVDVEAVKAYYKDSSLKLAAVTIEMDEFTGGLNPRSPKQMKEFIYEELKFKPMMKGFGKNKEPNLTTKTEDLLKLKATTKRQKKFLELKKEYARHNADISKTLKYFQGVATDTMYEQPLFYAQFNQCVTVTHRLSSSGITRVFDHMLDDKGKPESGSTQFQNMARHFKPLLKARNEGWDMGEADGSQLEFRVAGFLSQCAVAIQAIVNNLDVHSDTAAQLHGMPVEEFIERHDAKDPMVAGWRQDAKSDTFKPLYGGQSGTPEQIAYYDWFRTHYKGVGEMQQRWKDEALVNKEVVLPHGFKFYFPYCKLQKSGYVTDSTNICNYPVQHFATAEIIPIAIVYQWHLMREMESFLVNTVHDSVISELHPDEHEEFRERSKYAFTICVYHFLKEVYDVEFNVPLGVGVKIGRNWGKGKELKCAPTPPYKVDGIDYSQLITEWVKG